MIFAFTLLLPMLQGKLEKYHLKAEHTATHNHVESSNEEGESER